MGVAIMGVTRVKKTLLPQSLRSAIAGGTPARMEDTRWGRRVRGDVRVGAFWRRGGGSPAQRKAERHTLGRSSGVRGPHVSPLKLHVRDPDRARPAAEAVVVKHQPPPLVRGDEPRVP